MNNLERYFAARDDSPNPDHFSAAVIGALSLDVDDETWDAALGIAKMIAVRESAP